MTAPFPFTGIIDLEPVPAKEIVGIRNERGDVVGIWNIRDRSARTWFGWFARLLSLFRQIRVAAVLNFPNTAAQTSSSLTISFTIDGQTVPENSYVILNGPLDATTGAPAAGPANTSFSAQMSAVDVITVTFHNYSAAAVNPGSFGFECLIFLQR